MFRFSTGHRAFMQADGQESGATGGVLTPTAENYDKYENVNLKSVVKQLCGGLSAQFDVKKSFVVCGVKKSLFSKKKCSAVLTKFAFAECELKLSILATKQKSVLSLTLNHGN